MVKKKVFEPILNGYWRNYVDNGIIRTGTRRAVDHLKNMILTLPNKAPYKNTSVAYTPTCTTITEKRATRTPLLLAIEQF